MNIEKIMKQMKDNQERLVKDGYSISLYVHSKSGKQLQCLGDPAYLLIGVMTELIQIKKSCIIAGMKEDEFEAICKQAYAICIEEREKHE